MSTIIATSFYMLTSWYGPGFHGRITANGETYNQYAMTAAHKTLPFGTRLKVCLDGCVVVRVNDRGPYIGGRELDLSYGAAQEIGLVAGGVATTRVLHVGVGD
jgi:rare lipoprotein A